MKITDQHPINACAIQINACAIQINVCAIFNQTSNHRRWPLIIADK